MAKIAFIGLGHMGGGMAPNLAKAGHEVRAFDLSEEALAHAVERGCAKAGSTEEAVKDAEAVVTMLPAGRHVASLFCQHFSPELPDGSSWDEARDTAADLVIRTVTEYAPNFGDAVIGRSILTPLDLERRFGMIGGDIFHGRLSLDQLYAARPMLGHADYRAPIRNLYMCGAGTHPGGGVSGASVSGASVGMSPSCS